MRVSRLVQLLVRLQLHGGASATELAADLDISVRTIYRDVEALSAAGVPIYTEVGRHGGIRIDPAYRIAGLPRLDPTEARGLLFAVVPAIADQLGLTPVLPSARSCLPWSSRRRPLREWSATAYSWTRPTGSCPGTTPRC